MTRRPPAPPAPVHAGRPPSAPARLVRAALLPLCAWGALRAAEPAALLTPAALAEAAKADVHGGYGIERDDFTVPTRVPGEAEVTCHVAYGVAADGRPAARADEVVFYFPYPTERFQEGGLFDRLATEGGFTVCGVFFEHQDPKSVDVLHDEERSYLFHRSGSYDAMLAALDEVRRRRHLPDRPALAIGNSGGGILVQRVSEYAPERFAAVAGMGGGNYLRIRGSQAAHLAITTFGDLTDEANDGLCRLTRLAGHPAIRIRNMPDWGRRGNRGSLFFHCMNQVSFDLSLRFLEAVSDLRRAEGAIPPAERWPYAGDPLDHSRVVRTASPTWRADLAGADPVPLPSASVARLWMTRPWMPEELAPGIRWSRPAPVAEPRAVVVVCWQDPRPLDAERSEDPTVAQCDRTDWDLLELADHGCVALRIADGGKAAAALSAMAKRKPSWKDLPVVAVLSNPVASLIGQVRRLPGNAGIVVVQDAQDKAAGVAQALIAAADAKRAVRALVIADGKGAPSPLAELATRPDLVRTLSRDGRPPQFEHHWVCGEVLGLVDQLADGAVGRPKRP